jgi:hypothetical protein
MLRFVLPLALLGLALAAGSAAAQQAPFNCAEEFMGLRNDAEAKGKLIQAAGQRKALPAEVCPLFRRYAEAEAKMVRFMEQNQAWCQIPPDVVKGSKANHLKTLDLRTRICQAATAPAAAPASPSAGLSGALSGPVGGAVAPTPGGIGVFDTLTGNILQQ